MNEEAPQKLNFWERQYKGEPTRNQIVFDVVFGVVGPILCFMFDPIVFNSGGFGGAALLEDYKTFAYLFSAFEVTALAFWLLLQLRPGLLNGFFGGVLIAGSIFCSVIGLALLPYSIMGLVFVIGIFGFLPFVTAYVYYRNGYRAVVKAGVGVYKPARFSLIVLGCLFAWTGTFALTKGIDRFVTDSVEVILHGNDEQALNAAHRVRPLSLISGDKCRPIADEYRITTDSARKERLGRLYKEATGEEIKALQNVFD
jgi:hypothetical protein